MTTSGTVDFSVSRNEIIQEAYSEIGVYRSGQTMSAANIDIAAKRLNMMVKQWQGTADFAPGLKEWSRKRGYIFLQKGQAVYSLGPSGDNATSSYTRTTLSATEAGGQTVLSVTTSSGMTAADIIGIVLDTGYIQWTTINTTGVGTVTVNAALTSQASAGAYVYWYTTKMRQPLAILTAELRDRDSKDTELYMMRTVQEYEAIADKQADGDPTSFYYEFQLTNGVMYLDTEPDDVSKVIRVVFLSAIEDFDAANDTPDYPQVWYEPLYLGLGKRLCGPFGIKWTAESESSLREAMAIAKNTFPEVTDISFQPGLDE